MQLFRFLANMIVPASLRPQARLEKHLRNLTHGGLVVKGPFEGTKLRQESYYAPIYGKLLGCYEIELNPYIEEVIKWRPGLIIDVGAAEGYYACGLARRLPQTTVVAYEADYRFRYVLKRNIEANKLEDNVQVRGHCSVGDLRKDLAESEGLLFVLCDAEGYEHELLDAKNCPGLERAIILVETHEMFVGGVTDYIKNKFSATHEILQIASTERKWSDVPGVDSMPFARKANFDYFFRERPIPQSWLWMKPKKLCGLNSA